MATLLLLVSLLAISTHAGPHYIIGQPVNTTVGRVQGRKSDLRPLVSTYLGIPFAEPPLGDLRFAAPVAAATSNSTIKATAFVSPVRGRNLLNCPCNRIPEAPEYVGGPAGTRILHALALNDDAQDEDCLTINVWTKPQTGEAKKAVLFWVYGGGYSTGNTAQSITDGAIFADENDVVVVSANYRVNIFGFPGVPGVPVNLGLLDQRLALEWTRDNIGAFGGDPDRITIFGQSAGGGSVDAIGYAYPDDPIAHAIIPHSGLASSDNGLGANRTLTVENWFKASANAGCGNQTVGASSSIACMRTKSTEEILAAIAPVASSALASGFSPLDDERTHPANVSARVAAGNFAKLPFMAGNTINEAGFFAVLQLGALPEEQLNSLPYHSMQPLLDLATMIGWTCPSGVAVNYRVQAGVPAWRFLYYGGDNYTNTYIDRIGSNYHCSDLPLVWGTAELTTGIPDSPYEARMSAYLRRAWTTFAKDPENGLSEQLGWPDYGNNTLSDGPSVVQLAFNRQDKASFVPAARTDALCPAINALTAALGHQAFGVVLTGLRGFIAPNNSTPLALQLSGKFLP
ncbi:cholinesterase [Bisporella sp. PMI_857]|nr:cholinesterase [Bisporella sp. PMI_857]